MRKEYSVLLIGLACAIYPGIAVFGEGESEKISAQYAPWSLKIGGGIGRAEDVKYKENEGKTNNYRLSAEYNPRYFGFEFGITHKIFSLSVPSHADHILPYLTYINIGRNGNLSNETIYNAFVAAGDPLRDRNNFSLTFLDIGPTFHMRPGKTFDPYISIGAGTTGFDRFASYRGFARLGFKINFDRFFIFSEAEGSAINRYYVRDLRVNYNEYSGMVGVGFHFGGDESPTKKEEPITSLSSF
ncbi:hypothetical protein [Leptospira adleri]|uniref:Outer membrane protein beta-barrel domain-containing protein n=1 Tax=Leptospira adleri TaxID=2023186 RepID=A0A2M9YN22_9LEPT|nr:hypothetical protein [Leptospira adleri]PJZ52936.1 hypothetical protein CH380_12820 [Leptospira adleri]PJZ61366.1 hypothetical protein CH376_13780 [Leptospira adleri]